MVRSCVSAFGGIAACATPDTLVIVPLAAAVPLVVGLAELGLPFPGVTRAVCAGRLPCGRTGGGLGAKNLAQAKITIRDNSEATTMRSSCVSLNFFCGSLTNAPHCG